MIVRISRRENPFVQIDKRPLEDTRLSWKAKGILAYLLSKPDGWKVRTEDIIKHGSDGRDAVRAGMAELREFGYAELNQTRDGKEWVVYEEPKTGKPSMDPSPEKPTPDFAMMGKPAPSNKEKSERKNEERDIRLFPDMPAPKQRKGSGRAPLEAVETFVTTELQMPASDGAAMFWHFEEKGWPKNWQATCRKWKAFKYLPSQKNGEPNGNGKRNGTALHGNPFLT